MEEWEAAIGEELRNMKDPYTVAVSNFHTHISLQIADCFVNNGFSSNHRTVMSSGCLTTNLAFPLHEEST